MRRAALIPILLLAGCVGLPASDPPTESPAADDAQAPSPAEERPAETLDAPLPASEPEVRQHPFDALPGFALEGADQNGDLFATAVADLSLEGDVTGVLLEMEWTPASPANERLSLSLWPQESETLAPQETGAVGVQGASVLRLAAAREAIPEEGYVILVGSGMRPAGASTPQEGIVRVAIFRGVPFDPEYAFA